MPLPPQNWTAVSMASCVARAANTLLIDTSTRASCPAAMASAAARTSARAA